MGTATATLPLPLHTLAQTLHACFKNIMPDDNLNLYYVVQFENASV